LGKLLFNPKSIYCLSPSIEREQSKKEKAKCEKRGGERRGREQQRVSSEETCSLKEVLLSSLLHIPKSL